MTKPSDYSLKIHSNFGVWLGPRGGYGTPCAFGHMFEDAGKGFYHKENDDIDVTSHKYIENAKDLLIGFIKYYKLDGFTDSPCHNETHYHFVGGTHDMYWCIPINDDSF